MLDIPLSKGNFSISCYDYFPQQRIKSPIFSNFVDAKWTDVYYFIECDWSTNMFQSFWLSDGFVTRYNHSIKNQAQNLRILLIDFLAICYDPIFIYSIKEYFSLFPCLWADKTIRQANSELEEIIGSFLMQALWIFYI